MNIKTDRINQTLPLALQIMRARSLEYQKAWSSGEDAQVYDNYTAWHVYNTCASILAEAMDGNYEVLTQFPGDSCLPRIPESPCEVCEEAKRCTHNEGLGLGETRSFECSRWVAWNTKTAHAEHDYLQAAREAYLCMVNHQQSGDPEALEPGIDPCAVCSAVCCPFDVAGGREQCQAWLKYHQPSYADDPTCPCIACAHMIDCPYMHALNGKHDCRIYAEWACKTDK